MTLTNARGIASARLLGQHSQMRLLRIIAPLCALAACGSLPTNQEPVVPAKDFTVQAGKAIESQPNEPHLRNIRQLTFDGENAEAYWWNDGTKLVFQRKAGDMAADQIYVFDLATGKTELISTGKGRTTCAYFMPGDTSIVFARLAKSGLDSVVGTTNQILVTMANNIATLSIAANPVLPGTASATLPGGTTAQRPLTLTAGMIRYNNGL